MAKKLVYNYTFNPGAAGSGTIVFSGNYPLRTILLVTNVTDNVVIYNFTTTGSTNKGGSVSYSTITEETTLTLNYDTSSMSSDDELQIFIDEQESRLDLSETYIDPVSKIRVSEPQNLIDTDFEYGLQPTKWETIELVNNIPSFFASESEYTIANVLEILSTSGSQTITVVTSTNHGLSVGSPIDVQGLKSRTAEGKYLISSVPDLKTFTYTAREVQSISGILNGSYTTITPGEFYSNSEIEYNDETGIVTDEETPSSLSVYTPYVHGFDPGTSVYLTNTIGAQLYKVTAGAATTAPDGRPYVDFADSFSDNQNPDTSLTETKQMTGANEVLKFLSSAVNTSTDKITWPNSGLSVGDPLLYVPPSGDTEVGGLQRFQIYYVKTVDSSGITLCATTSGSFNNATIDLTSQGTSNYGRHQLIRGYEITQANKTRRSFNTDWAIRQNFTASTSIGTKYMFAARGQSISTIYHDGQIYSTAYLANFSFAKSGTTPDGYDFIEDFRRFSSDNRFDTVNSSVVRNGTNSFRTNTSSFRNTRRSYTDNYGNSGNYFVFFLEFDSEGDSFYIQNHGLSDSSIITVTTDSGSNITYRTETSTTYNGAPTFTTFSSGTASGVTVLSQDRFRLNNVERLATNTGAYTFTAVRDNLTKNSFYIGENTITDRKPIIFRLGSGGSFPSTATGAISPSINTIQSVYSAVLSELDSLRTTMGSDATSILYNGSTDNTPLVSNAVSFDSGIQQFGFARTSLTLIRSTPSTTLTTLTGSLPSSGWANGVPYDAFSSSEVAGDGYYIISTPFFSNSLTPYHVDVLQVPNIKLFDGGLNRASFYYGSSSGSHGLISGTRDSVNNNYTSWSTKTGGWRYTYETNYFAPTATTHGLISMFIIIDNTNWNSYYQLWTSDISFAAASSIVPTFAGDGGQRYMIHALIPVKAGTTTSRYGASGSIKTNAQIASDIVDQVITSLTNPSFSVGDNSVYANVIGSNRISLETVDSVEYNLTSSGASEFEFEVPESTGSLDGYYEVVGTGATSLRIYTNSTINNRSLPFDGSDIVTIDSARYINIGSHKLKQGQRLVYTETTGGIQNLIPNTNYYAIPAGPDHVQLASSYSNAKSSTAIGIGSTASGSFSLSIPSISGISSAPGTVGLTTNTKTVTGSGTLFKRYFKEGDIFKIENREVYPSEYVDYVVDSVIDDENLTLTTTAGIGSTSAFHYIETNVNVRPDGTFLHRPFDGGVEITAGTSPNSSIVRQTRKYFRYQSGKGIQCSLAINFNPSRVATSVVGYDRSIILANTYTLNVYNEDNAAYVVSGTDRDGKVVGDNAPIAVYQGDTLNFNVNAPGHPFLIKTVAGVGAANSVTTGVTNGGEDVGTIIWNTSGISTGTYYYQCQNHASMYGEIEVLKIPAPTASESMVNVQTKYPHGIQRGRSVTIKGASDSTYNGTFEVVSNSDEFNFQYLSTSRYSSSIPNGIIEYNIDAWENSYVRCGLFDYQNGFFFEFDGSTLYAVRRSSVQQLPGTVSVTKNSHIINGTETSFIGQVSVGEYVVIRGSSYRITAVVSNSQLHVQPSYRGISASDVIITKTVDTKVPQSEWNIDVCDGTGPSGFLLDKTKIQMAYLDYSWYGAGKIRFGFKDTYGHVKYAHEFRHNNRLEEAYMRSGNIPGRYEIANIGNVLPSYVPSLFHWGTSIIMDGRFDDDKAYLFTASSNNLTFTNGDSSTATTTAQSQLYEVDRRGPEEDWYVRIPFATADASKFSSGTQLYTSDGALNGEVVSFTEFIGSTLWVYIFIQRSVFPPAVYPIVANATSVSIGAPASGGSSTTTVDLTQSIPLLSIRLAPSVDNNLTGLMGAREIVNRMQLQLNSLGITVSHDCTIDLSLNGSISNKDFENVNRPSLSQLVRHVSGDKISGGTNIYSLRASGNTTSTVTTDFDLSKITDLGNAILGGNGVFPNGPDLLTISIKPLNTTDINSTTPLIVSSRITWTESQA